MMKQDIKDRDDIVLLVNSFYDAVRQNKILGHIFNDVAKVNWDEHLPKMYSFWGSILLGEHSYSGNPMRTHIELAERTSMTKTEFNEWVSLFAKTVNEHFIGKIADNAKFRAAHIANTMLHNILKASA